MSSKLGNTVSPIDVLMQRGVDTTRLAMYFAAPAGKDVLWSDEGVVGVERFAGRLYRMVADCERRKPADLDARFARDSLDDAGWGVYVKLNQTIKKITEDIDKLHFNTCIAAVMELLNEFSDITAESHSGFYQYVLQKTVQLMAPITPHLSEELWEMFGHTDTVFRSKWPEPDPNAIVEDLITIVVQVNGKVRANLEVPPDISEDSLIAEAKSNERVVKFIEGKTVIKEIVVPGRLVNIVVK
jgi:leucyl-tRNA synthetase